MFSGAYTPKTYDEKKKLSGQHFAANRAEVVSETTPQEVTAKHAEFASTLGGELARIPVVNDEYGLYGWCSDGVFEKIKHDGGSIVFGWTVWEWPKVLLTAEFHAVWRSPNGELVDITPKPHGEIDIIFVPDLTYPQDFDFDKRPRNQRFRLYQPVDNAPVVEQQIARMKPVQRAYEERRASKAGKTLSEWLLAKHAADLFPALIDKMIAAVGRREEAMDAAPGFGFITPSRELLEIAQECQRLIDAVKAATPQ